MIEKQVFTVSNMNCDGCISSIKQALEADKRIKFIDFQLSRKKVFVSGDISPEETAKIMVDAGYQAEVGEQKVGFLGRLFSS